MELNKEELKKNVQETVKNLVKDVLKQEFKLFVVNTINDIRGAMQDSIDEMNTLQVEEFIDKISH